MIKTDELLGIIAKNRLHQTDVAAALDIAPRTFYLKMKKGVFASDEIEKMVDLLHIDNPMDIFFTKK